jgi:hypothetical protein
MSEAGAGKETALDKEITELSYLTHETVLTFWGENQWIY